MDNKLDFDQKANRAILGHDIAEDDDTLNKEC